MYRKSLRYALSVVILGLGASTAGAVVGTSIPSRALATLSATTPAAMCGYSCRSGGRYIPGPPSVCAEQGLNFCGPSRGAGGPPPGFRRDDGYRGYDGGGRGCRTITIERDDGSIRRITRCD